MEEPTQHPASGEFGRVDLRVPARTSHLFLIRAMAEGAMVAADFDLDTVADTKLAADQAASALVLRATTGASLTCRFRTYPDQVRVSMSVRCVKDADPIDEGFGWYVLTTLTDSAAATMNPPDGDAPKCLVEFSLSSPAPERRGEDGSRFG